jgi:hypothetical protein
MREELIAAIKSMQLKISASKASLESDRKVQSFVELLNDYPEAWNVIFRWKKRAKPLVIVEPSDFNFVKLKSEIINIISDSHYLREFAYSFFEQYEEYEHDNERAIRVNEFLKKSRDAGILEPKKEYMLYCSQCGKTILINRPDEKSKCSCGTSYDFRFSIVSVPNKIAEGVVSGQLLELFALRVIRMIDGIKLIGMEIGEEKRRFVYTSIEYAGIGVGDKMNGELDLLGLQNDSIIAIECKFNETTSDDINDFLGVSDKLLLKIRENYLHVKMRKLIFSYDASKLRPTNVYSVISLRNASSANDIVKEIAETLH